MNGVNKVILVGRTGKDPESKIFDNGSMVVNIPIATSESWKDKTTGEKKEATEWHKVVFHGRLAEIADMYVSKGDLLYVEGKNKTNKWTDKEGNDKYQTVVQASSLQILSSKERKQENNNATAREYQKAQESGVSDFDPTDIPF